MASPKFTTFLDPAQIVELQGLIRQGYATVQEFQDPEPVVMIREFDELTGRYVDLEEVRLIRISFGLRELRDTSGTPIAERTSDGDLLCWADEFELKVGHRFTWDGKVCEVSAVYPEKNGVVNAEIELKQ